MDLIASIASALRAEAPATARLLAAYELATGDGSVEAAAALGVSRSAYYRNAHAAAALVAASAAPAVAPRLALVPAESHQWDSQSHQRDCAVGGGSAAPTYPQIGPSSPQGCAQTYPQADRGAGPFGSAEFGQAHPEKRTYPQDRRRGITTRGKPAAANSATACRPGGSSPPAAATNSDSAREGRTIACQFEQDWHSACRKAGQRVPLCLTTGEAAVGLRSAVATYGARTVLAVHAHALAAALEERIPAAFYAKMFVGGGWSARYSAYAGRPAQMSFEIGADERDILSSLGKE